jgi:hypothetical protein
MVMRPRALWGLLLAGAIVCAAAGCGGDGGGGGGTARVTGRVLDDGSQAPVQNADVRVGGAAGQSRADGSFAVGGAPTGSQVLTVTAAGHEVLNRPVVLAAGDNAVGNCYIAPTMAAGRGAIAGQMRLSTGGFVSGGQVQTATESATSRSDGTGRFTLYNLPSGYTQVSFHDPATGASTWKNVNVVAGSTPTDIGTVTLGFGPPPPPS